MFGRYEPSQQHLDSHYAAASFCGVESVDLITTQPPVQWEPTYQTLPNALPLYEDAPYLPYLDQQSIQQQQQQHQESVQQQQHHQQHQQHQQQQQQQQQYHHHYHQQQQQHHHQEQQQEAYPQPAAPPPDGTLVKKKRGRPVKQQQQQEEGTSLEEQAAAAAKKAKRDLNRFNGMSVAEVMSRTLPDVIAHNLDILIIGINPGLMSAYKGHHYPNPGNHFWKCLFLSGFTQQQLNYSHDQDLPRDYGIGFTNMVERTTPGSKDLSSKEIREGGHHLLDKLQKYKPLIAAFNGKGIYEIFCKETFGVKAKNLEFGLQPYRIPETETVCYLMPSSSPRCAQFPRAQDKVHFYLKLKELRDQLKGAGPSRDVQETHYSFDLQLAKEDAKRMAIKEEQEDPGYEGTPGPHGVPY
ncbi:G/T mismatch-specific thymine DNA glycosylase [Nelusetta ayraudi]|uniref:G/T mismatch-specific thymine DNA glycosylase n=1 Tax=Nelusetta ayraudi TaxID=303726 RepID=UPI003F730FED